MAQRNFIDQDAVPEMGEDALDNTKALAGFLFSAMEQLRFELDMKEKQIKQLQKDTGGQ